MADNRQNRGDRPKPRPRGSETVRESGLRDERAAQRGSVPPEVSGSVGDLGSSPDPREKVTRLGTTSEEADRNLKDRQRSGWGQRLAPREKGSRWISGVAIFIGLVVIVWLIVANVA